MIIIITYIFFSFFSVRLFYWLKKYSIKIILLFFYSDLRFTDYLSIFLSQNEIRVIEKATNPAYSLIVLQFQCLF